MVHKHQIQAQLKELGITIKNWGVGEVNELPQILMPDEQIKALINGWYANGFAALVATDQRLLLIDKKLLHLTIEDVRYDMIAEVDFNAQLFDATVCINTLNKQLKFTSFKKSRLRELTKYVQYRVMQLRQHQFTAMQFEETPIPDFQNLVQAQFVPQPAAPITPQVSPVVSLPHLQDTVREIGSSLKPSFKPSLTTTHKFLPKIPRRRHFHHQ